VLYHLHVGRDSSRVIAEARRRLPVVEVILKEMDRGIAEFTAVELLVLSHDLLPVTSHAVFPVAAAG
jgi:hypothetical protein